MVKYIISAVMLIVLFVSFSTITSAQDKTKKAEKKMEMAKDEKAMGPLKSVACDPACGFMVRSHDEKELISMVKQHAKKMHKMDLNDAQVKEKMKNEEGVK